MHSFIQLFILSAFLSLAGCSKKSNTAEPATPGSTTSEGGSAEGTMQASCPAGGQPRAEGVSCGAVYQGCCFADADAACAAAGCGEKCIHAESMPVQVSCADASTQPAPTTPPNQ